METNEKHLESSQKNNNDNNKTYLQSNSNKTDS